MSKQHEIKSLIKFIVEIFNDLNDELNNDKEEIANLIDYTLSLNDFNYQIFLQQHSQDVGEILQRLRELDKIEFKELTNEEVSKIIGEVLGKKFNGEHPEDDVSVTRYYFNEMTQGIWDNISGTYDLGRDTINVILHPIQASKNFINTTYNLISKPSETKEKILNTGKNIAQFAWQHPVRFASNIGFGILTGKLVDAAIKKVATIRNITSPKISQKSHRRESQVFSGVAGTASAIYGAKIQFKNHFKFFEKSKARNFYTPSNVYSSSNVYTEDTNESSDSYGTSVTNKINNSANSELSTPLDNYLNSSNNDELNNSATQFFIGDGSPNNPSHKKFTTWYHPQVCHYLLQLVPNSAKCIRVMFLDVGDDNTKSFKSQLQQLILLGNRLQRPAVFICKEPGANNHYICGLLKNNDLLLINPLGIYRNQCFETLIQLKQERTLENIWLSSNSLQKIIFEGENLVSCGPVALEFAIHLLSNFTPEIIKDLWLQLNNIIQKDLNQSEFVLYPVDVSALLSNSLDALENTTSNLEYQLIMVKNIREVHYNLLKSLPSNFIKNKNITIENYLEQIRVIAPAQVIFNALSTEYKTINNINDLPEYRLLENELKQDSNLLNFLSVTNFLKLDNSQEAYSTQIDEHSCISMPRP